MKLVVIGKESCGELQKMVETYFDDVKNFDVDTPRWNESPYGPDEVQTRIDLLPVMDIRELVLMFPVPDQTHLYKSGVSRPEFVTLTRFNLLLYMGASCVYIGLFAELFIHKIPHWT